MQAEGDTSRDRLASWIALACCAGIALGWAAQRLVPNQEDVGRASVPDWLPLVAAGVAAAGAILPAESHPWRSFGRALRVVGLLLLVSAASGLPFDLLTMAGLIGHRTASGEIVISTVYWPGLATRAFALAAAVLLARVVLARPANAASNAPRWFGYAAFVLALPYPVLRVHWALGGTLGITSPGAAGVGWDPLLIAFPWALAAVLSLMLVSPPPWMPRRLLLAAGWTATVIVAMIGPAAFWGFVAALVGGSVTTGDIEVWVFGLFYGSWFLWAVLGGAATRAYQLRTATAGRLSPA
jgi:hypothetical protein